MGLHGMLVSRLEFFGYSCRQRVSLLGQKTQTSGRYTTSTEQHRPTNAFATQNQTQQTQPRTTTKIKYMYICQSIHALLSIYSKIGSPFRTQGTLRRWQTGTCDRTREEPEGATVRATLTESKWG
jgi:hypothetical protein